MCLFVSAATSFCSCLVGMLRLRRAQVCLQKENNCRQPSALIWNQREHEEESCSEWKAPGKQASCISLLTELCVFKLLFLLDGQNSWFFHPTLMSTWQKAEKRSHVKVMLFAKCTSTLLLTPAQALQALYNHSPFCWKKGLFSGGEKSYLLLS